VEVGTLRRLEDIGKSLTSQEVLETLYALSFPNVMDEEQETFLEKKKRVT
jgi:hypothetical protein